ncbi:MAG: hypothetical protein QNK37_21175 [Acidobacteriota bacterium]|nr:hypothetical protein [Acidobacteriota bacterium]
MLKKYITASIFVSIFAIFSINATAGEFHIDRLNRNDKPVKRLVYNIDASGATQDPGTVLDETYGDDTDTVEVGDPIGVQIVLNMDASGSTQDPDPGTVLDETYGDDTDTVEVGDPIGKTITINLEGDQRQPARTLTIRLPQQRRPQY